MNDPTGQIPDHKADGKRERKIQGPVRRRVPLQPEGGHHRDRRAHQPTRYVSAPGQDAQQKKGKDRAREQAQA